MPRCAFLTLAERGDFVIDDALAIEPLAARGWQVDEVHWQTPDPAWADYDLVVIRSTWDYFDAPRAFLARLREIEAVTQLANPLSLVEWNLDKRYLLELQARGASIVPSTVLESCTVDALEMARADLGGEIVVKPAIGANGEDTFRIGNPSEAKRATRALEGRACLAQPFRPAILSEGEYSLFWLGDAVSHAIRKVPQGGEFRSQEERGAEIRSVPVTRELAEAGRRALHAVAPTPLYARADFVRNPDGVLEVMELELIEPSLYLRTDPAAPERLAEAIVRWFASIEG